MSQPTLFEFAVVYHPTGLQVEESGAKSEVIVGPQTVLAKDVPQVRVVASRAIPDTYSASLDQVEILVRPF